jgi:DNA-directed RNA polymerase specialized sigma24 family protein
VSLDEYKDEKDIDKASVELGKDLYLNANNLMDLQRIEKLFNKLSANSRRIFSYRYQDHLSWDEVAKIMGSQKENLKSILNHNKNHLKELVKNE